MILGPGGISVKIHKIFSNLPLVSGARLKYNKIKQMSKPNVEIEKEGWLMTDITQKLNQIELPPHIMRELGLDKDWKKKISPEFLEKVVQTAEKYKDVLKELSKY